MANNPKPVHHFYRAQDGRQLHVCEYHATGVPGGALPAVCLPGLTRSAADFERLAVVLSARSHTPRRVLAFDYRGRGLSEHDPDPRNYTLAVERDDILTWLRAEGINAAHFIGTSRGGLQIIDMAQSCRSLIAAVVLNDIGPVLKLEGLQRIRSYVGAGAPPSTLEDAISILKNGPGQHFDGLSFDEWTYFAETTFGPDPADMRRRYDPALKKTLEALDLTKPLPEMWEQYDALRGAPVLTIRGANSDLLSAATHAKMAERWPGCASITVAGQGHAPLLADAPTMLRIDAFLAANEGAALNVGVSGPDDRQGASADD